MHDTEVRDGRARPDLEHLSRRPVQDGAVLHVRTGAHDERTVVRAQYDAVPHRRVLFDRDVADD